MNTFGKPTIWELIKAERTRAHAKHGANSMENADPADPTGRRFRILTEEIGEVAKEFNDAEVESRAVDMQAVRDELIQVAAMAAAWADAIPVLRSHPFKAGHSGMTCVEMVMRDGGGDSCNMPANSPIHDDPRAGQDFDYELPGMWERSDFE